MEKRTGLVELAKVLPQQSEQLTTVLSEASELFREDELDKIIATALSYAIRERKAEVKRAEYSKKVMSEYEAPKLTWQEFLTIVLNQAKEKIEGFALNQEEEKIYRNLAKYFTNDKSFEGSLKKGLLLFGSIGCGKTTALKLFQINPKQSYAFYPCRRVSDEFTKDGAEALMKYTGMIFINQPELYYGQKSVGICYDDLGTEQSAKHFGNERNVMAEIMLTRYDVEQLTGFNIHMTTNLNVEEIEQYYGPRVKSRMREMFNVIHFPANAKDKRK